MSAHADSHSHSSSHEPAHYVRIWAILVVLLVVSVLGPMLGIRVVTLIAAFGIALVKAYMVMKNFMHLDVEKPVIHYALGLALVIMVLMYAGIAPDVQKSTGQRWVKSPGFHYVSPAAEGEAANAHEKAEQEKK